MKIKRSAWLRLLLLLVPGLSFGTNQYLEKIIYQGATNDLLTLVLSSELAMRVGTEVVDTGVLGTDRFQTHVSRKMSSACWRGYKGLWRIQNGTLYLCEVTDVDDVPTQAAALVEGAVYPIKADWFSGTLRIPQGKPIVWHYGFGRLFEKEIQITIEKGMVVGEPYILNRLDEMDAFKQQVKPLELSPRQIDKDLYNYTFHLHDNYHDKKLDALVQETLGSSSNFFNFSRMLVKKKGQRRNLYRLIPTAKPRIYERQSIYGPERASEEDAFRLVAFIDDDKAITLYCPPKNEPGEPYPATELVIADALDRLTQLQESLAGWKPQEHPTVPEGAHVFNSKLPLKVVVNHGVHTTPGEHPIILPTNSAWQIIINQPIDPIAFFESLKGLPPPELVFKTPLPDSFFNEIPKLERLASITFANDAPFTDAHLNPISRLPNLTKLEAWTPKITDAGMTYFSRMEKLGTSNLYGTQISDAGMKSLAGLTQLRHLRLRAPNLTDAGLQPLANLTKLEKLALYKANLGDAGMAHLSGLTNLVNLDLTVPLLTDKGMSSLAELKNLTYIRLRHAKLGNSGLAILAQFAELEKIEIGGPTVTDEGLAPLAKLKKLKSLTITPSQIKGPGARSLSQLTFLALAHSLVDESSAPIFAKMDHLTFLNLDDSRIGDEGLALLLKAGFIDILRLNGTQVTDMGLMNLTTETTLGRLLVGRTSITDCGIASIAKCPNLSVLYLNDTAITDQCLNDLYTCKKLWYLNIKNTGITPAGVAQLKKELPDCTIER